MEQDLDVSFYSFYSFYFFNFFFFLGEETTFECSVEKILKLGD